MDFGSLALVHALFCSDPHGEQLGKDARERRDGPMHKK